MQYSVAHSALHQCLTSTAKYLAAVLCLLIPLFSCTLPLCLLARLETSQDARRNGHHKKPASLLLLQFESDDEAAKEEEEEALRLQKAQASKLSRAQFGLPEDLSEEEADEQGNEAIAAKAKTLGATAEVCPPLRRYVTVHGVSGCRCQIQRIPHLS